LDDDFALWLDTDRDPSTGDQRVGIGGVDYAIYGGMTLKSASLRYYVWRDGEMREYRGNPIRYTVNSQRVLIRLDRHLAGDTNGFRFRTEVREVTSLGGNQADSAPDSGTWSFPVRISRRSIRPSLTTSRHARAGGRFVAQLTLRVAQTKQLLGSGRVACHASVRGRLLEPMASGFHRRRAACVWNVPPGSRARTIRGSVAVQVTERFRVTRRFALPIE
jgi:hypothetical protein